MKTKNLRKLKNYCLKMLKNLSRWPAKISAGSSLILKENNFIYQIYISLILFYRHVI